MLCAVADDESTNEEAVLHEDDPPELDKYTWLRIKAGDPAITSVCISWDSTDDNDFVNSIDSKDCFLDFWRQYFNRMQGMQCTSLLRLSELDLSDNSMDNEGINALGDVLANSTTIRTLNLSANRFVQ